MKLMSSDHDYILSAISSGKATAEEQHFLSAMTVAYAANEDISQADYYRVQALTGGALNPSVVPVCDR